MGTGRDLLRGVTVPLVTPMAAPGRPSATAGRRLLSAVHRAGADALMLLGSNGEGPLLPTSAIGAFVTDAVTNWRSLGGGRPVLVNVTGAGTAEVLSRADAVLPARPDALVLSPPIYFHHRDDEIVAHYAACAELGVPVVAYNVPQYSNPISPTVFEALLEMPHVVGVKDSSGDIDALRRAVAVARDRRPDFGIGQGTESALTAGLDVGADGIVPGIANIAPVRTVELFQTWRDRSAKTAEQLQAVVDRLSGVHRIRRGVPTVKEILSWHQLCPAHVAPPLLPCTGDERARLRRYLHPLSAHLVGASTAESIEDGDGPRGATPSEKEKQQP